MVQLITNTLKFAVKQIFIVLRFATPLVVRFLIFTMGVSIRLSLVAVLTMFRGVDNVAVVIAEDWKHRAIDSGFPTLWETHLLSVFRVLAVCTIFAGWTVMFFISVFTLYITYKLVF